MIADEGCSGHLYIILNGSYRGYFHCSTTDCAPEFACLEPTFGAFAQTFFDP